MYCSRLLMIMWMVMLTLFTSFTMANAPQLISYQGYLTDSEGVPLDGTYDFNFRIYDTDSGGTALWHETHNGVLVSNGLFNVLLGSIGSPSLELNDDIFSDSSRWLGISVNSDPEIDPRTKLVSSAFSFRVSTVDGASGGTIVDSLTVDGTLHVTSGGVRFPDGTIQYTEAGASNGLPMAGGTMTGPIESVGNPPITMGKGNFGTNNTNDGTNAFVAGENNEASGDYCVVAGGHNNEATGEYDDSARVTGGAFIGSGYDNTASGVLSIVCGGSNNTASGGVSIVCGGDNNLAAGYRSGIIGGLDNIATGWLSFILHGNSNEAAGPYSYIGNGYANHVGGSHSYIGNGVSNNIANNYSFIGGGGNNNTIGLSNFIGGGNSNSTLSDLAVIVGGYKNESGGRCSFIGGGENDTTGGLHSIIVGGYTNRAGDEDIDTACFVGGGWENSALARYSVVVGGLSNSANGLRSGVVAGRGNTANSTDDFVGGGYSNDASGGISAIVGGTGNEATGVSSFIGGGQSNISSGGAATVLGGSGNDAIGDFSSVGGGSGNTAAGGHSIIPGGYLNYAGGYLSLAAGFKAKTRTDDTGSFVWSDHSSQADFESTGKNQFLIRAEGGVGIGTNAPQQAMDVNGIIQTTGFKMPTGAVSDYVLTCDADGNGTWQLGGSGGDDGDWTITGNDMYSNVSGNIGIGNASPSFKLDVNGDASFSNDNSSDPTITVQNLSGRAAHFIRGSGSYGESNAAIQVNVFDNGYGAILSSTGTGAGLSGRNSGSGPSVEGWTQGGSGPIFRGITESTNSNNLLELLIDDGYILDPHFLVEHSGKTYIDDDLTVNGKALMTEFELPTGASAGYVLTCDASGNGTWQAPVSANRDFNNSWSAIVTDAIFADEVISTSNTIKIDHPLDPENKYLMHSSIESPDMMNVYNGNVVTDGNGFATVQLPDYFESLNKDFRYQLTVIGEFAQAIVKDEIKDNTFSIMTDKPNVKVSWQVTGVRNDASAIANRMPVEVDKTESERGKYIDPEAFGLTVEMGVNYAPNPNQRSVGNNTE